IIPTKIKIEKLNIEAKVEHVGLDTTGKMDVPKEDDNAAWYDLGYKPGQKGNAVIAAHFDKVTGEPAIFYKLSELEAGDTIKIYGEDGKEEIFIVKDKELYETSAFPVEKVFGKSDKKMLNLITCNGVFDPNNKLYDKRLVVFAEKQ
ncbi:MAG TPA: class F sortase, partial [Candidatus Nitrosocosmicus sp.]|nr:class F sortase [Candidatus Nitrosocosmicus sp.]